ncbi:alpha/beta fold hydrolase [Saccharothrix longispora]|uniref:Pimeloyl-ACP methyl ester carboxylesterase n=1 Tax=Saccharothrix longispora TaxID=33920 RepID=A0ABU1PVQ2_9PSEU|nr:alpha/beta hydrolase [Saccharothrix longispora]MDR6593969.1 pimeloyl-ACP methyl ester carboxylesterase [Saccharothrix longispora]
MTNSSYSRRTALRAAAAGAAASGLTLAGGGAAARAGGRRGTTTFVVVTGASGTPGGIDALSLRGHRTVGVPLPGHRATDAQFAVDYQCPQDAASLATRPSPMAGVGLDAYTAAAVDVVRTVAGFGPVVLYGGSMGGATLNRVGNAVPHLVDRMVYDTAFCCVDLSCPEEYLATPEGSTSLGGDLADLIVADPAVVGAVRINYRTADRAALAKLKEVMMAGADDAEFHGLLACLQPDESPTVGREDCRVRADTWGRVPRTYIRHTADRMIPLALQDRMIAEADRLTPRNRFDVHTVDAPHAANAAQFGRIVDILDALPECRR